MYSTVRGPSYRDHSDSRVDDMMVKLHYKIDERQNISAIGQYYEGKADMPGGLSTAQYAANPYQSVRPYDSFWGHRWLGGVTYEFKPTDRAQWTTTAFKTHTLRSGYLDQGTNLTLSPRVYNVTGVETRYSQGFDLGPTRHLITAGYRYIHETGAENRYSARKALGILPTQASTMDRDTRGLTDAHALYIDDRIAIGDFTVTPGLRYEFIKSGQTNLLTRATLQGDYSVPLPALNLTYSPARRWMIFANTMGSFGTVQYSAISVAAATNYGPEKARTWEAGGRYDDGHLKLEGTLFYIHFDNQYDSNQQTNIITDRGKTRHQGVELAASYRLSGALAGIELYANYSYVDATIREEGPNKGNRLPFSSRHTAQFGANYRHGPWSVNIDGRGQSSQFADDENTVAENAAGNTGLIPGFVVFGGRVAHDFGPELSHLSIGAGMRNIFDRRYYTRSYDDNNSGKYVEEPRTIYVQLSAKL
jgi:Fe(3+) dicitrate transport protein